MSITHIYCDLKVFISGFIDRNLANLHFLSLCLDKGYDLYVLGLAFSKQQFGSSAIPALLRKLNTLLANP
ncbi:hypothetical protein [Nostoc sp. DSM 114167]|uniref:hypothetical protein n=1 Tax=Nostoc sp. DSM 114167 TaxID=3439050 RepID=UPI0040457AF0